MGYNHSYPTYNPSYNYPVVVVVVVVVVLLLLITGTAAREIRGQVFGGGSELRK